MSLEIVTNIDQLIAQAGELPTIKRAQRDEEPLPEVFDELLPKLMEMPKQYVPVINGVKKFDDNGDRSEEYTKCLTTIQRWNRQLKDRGFRASHRSLNEGTVAVFLGYDPEAVEAVENRRRS